MVALPVGSGIATEHDTYRDDINEEKFLEEMKVRNTVP